MNNVPFLVKNKRPYMFIEILRYLVKKFNSLKQVWQLIWVANYDFPHFLLKDKQTDTQMVVFNGNLQEKSQNHVISSIKI